MSARNDSPLALTLVLSLTLSLALLLGAAPAQPASSPGDESLAGKASIKVELEGAEATVPLVRQPDGTYRFQVERHEGGVDSMTPDELAARVYREQAGRGFWLRLLNITSPFGLVWVALGLLGQAVFAGRMLVQWVASERERRSVVPQSFWWMSLVGSSMLIVYFIWRKDVVGVLGQATGWWIYGRNLWLIRKAK